MAIDLRVLEIACGVVAVVFAIHGVRMLTLLNADEPLGKSNMTLISNGLFLIFFNVSAAIMCIKPDISVAQFFGYLASWTGRASHFLLMGFYIYPVTCQRWVRARSRCFERAEMFEKILMVSSFASILLGIILFVLRFTVVTSSHTFGGGGSSMPLDALAIAAAIASAGMLAFGFLHLQPILNSNNTALDSLMFNIAIATFLLVAGAFSFVASLTLSAVVNMYFGFLYNQLGRGVFYLCMGFYMFPQIPGGSKANIEMACKICSFVSMIVGVVYVVLYCFIKGSRTTTARLSAQMRVIR